MLKTYILIDVAFSVVVLIPKGAEWSIVISFNFETVSKTLDILNKRFWYS